MAMVKCKQCSERFELNDVPGPIQNDYKPLCFTHSDYQPEYLRPKRKPPNAEAKPKER